MRYTADEKREIIKLVEQSSLPISQTLKRLDINKSTFYNWLGRYRCGGDEALSDKHPKPSRVWNKLPESKQTAVVDLALSEPELSPRELAVKYTDEAAYFVSESTVYRLLKAQDLITSPTYILMQASAKFQQPTMRVNQMWQTDFTYLKVIGWVGITCLPFWTTTPGLLWPGVYARRCRQGMSQILWMMRLSSPVWIRSTLSTNPGCSAIMVPHTWHLS